MGAATMTPEKLDLMVQVLPTARSFRDICKMLGVAEKAARKHAVPFLALMKLNGSHPVCGCGKLRFHQGACVALNREKWDATPGVLEKRAAAVEMFVGGVPLKTIERALRSNARKYAYTDEQRDLRGQAIAARRARKTPATRCTTIKEGKSHG